MNPAEISGIAVELCVIVGLTLLNGVFSGAEIAVVAIRRTRIQELVDNGSNAAKAVMRLKSHPETFLATVQIGITVISAAAAAFGGASIAKRLEPLLSASPALAPHATTLSLAMVVALVSYLSIILGELVPKSLAPHAAERFALLIGRPFLGLAWIARPLVWLLTKSSNIVLRPFGDRTTFTEARHSADELQQLVEEAMEAGTVHRHAGEIAARALEFAELRAIDVMVPRQQVIAVPRDATAEDLRRIILENAHTRLPVYEAKVDNVVGYLNVKDLLALAWEQRLIVLEDVIRPGYYVPESKRAGDLLHEMRQKRTPIAIVVDEQGGMSGIVTMEDLVEELVGEIFTEHAGNAPELIKRESDGTALVAGMTPIREVNRELGLELPEDPTFNTIAGLCLSLAGGIPATGDRLAAPNGCTLHIVDATPRHVRMVRIVPPAKRET